MKNNMKPQIFITDLEGNQIEVTNVDKAIKQCKKAISFHEFKIKQNHPLTYPAVLEDYKYKLKQLEKFLIK